MKTFLLRLSIFGIVALSAALNACAVYVGGEDFPENSIGAYHLKTLLSDNTFRANLQHLQSKLNQRLSERKDSLEMSLMTFDANLAASYRQDVLSSTPPREHVLDRLLHMRSHATLVHQWNTINDHRGYSLNLERMLARIALYVEKNPMDIYIAHPKRAEETYGQFCPIGFPFYEKITKEPKTPWILPFKEMLTGYIRTYNFSDITLTEKPHVALMKSPSDLIQTESVGPNVTGEVFYQSYGPEQMRLAIPMVEHFIIPLITLMRNIQKQHLIRIATEHTDVDLFLINAFKEFGFDYPDTSNSENTQL